MQHGAGLAQPHDDLGVLVDDAGLEVGGAPGRRHALGREEVLHAVGQAVQRTAVLAGLDLGVGLRRLGPRLLLHDRHGAQQRRD